jgi:adenosine deaminase
MAVDFRALPKIELHCHLDACLRIATVAELGRELGLHLPDPVAPALIAPDVCANLFDYISRLDLALEVMQRSDDLTRIALELVEDMAAENVIYAEVRFAPQLHTRMGLSMPAVVDAVRRGLELGRRQHGVRTGLILCALRHQPAELGRRIAELAASLPDQVCALDLAGDEGGHPDAAPHRAAFAIAREAGLHVTVHAGENGGAGNVRDALDLLGAERIGHGVRAEEDPALLDRLARESVALDMCPRSNVQTRAVPSMDRHPIDRLLRQGLRVTVSTDGRTTSDTTVTGEFARLQREFDWGLGEFAACQRNAALAAFAPEEVRQELFDRLAVLPGP